MADFDRAVDKLLKLEGGFHPIDVSPEVGAVNWGITQRFLRSIGRPSSVEDVRSLTRKDAKEIYRKYFWNPLLLSRVKDQRIAETVFIAAVNTGPASAVKSLQKALNNIGFTVKVDGILGPKTLAATNAAPSTELLEEYKRLLRDRYVMVATRRPDLYSRYLRGWLSRLEST